jgi:hypothetical protein
MDGKDLQLVFIDLEKVYDREPCEIVWKSLEKKVGRIVYIRVIKDMHKGASTSLRKHDRATDDFPITIGLDYGST